jgi:hypothetical protein
MSHSRVLQQLLMITVKFAEKSYTLSLDRGSPCLLPSSMVSFDSCITCCGTALTRRGKDHSNAHLQVRMSAIGTELYIEVMKTINYMVALSTLFHACNAVQPQNSDIFSE